MLTLVAVGCQPSLSLQAKSVQSLVYRAVELSWTVESERWPLNLNPLHEVIYCLESFVWQQYP
ncbi:hypothetical protein H6F88_05765 [Oculatella sp. FACHB-28]|uniref:hypothetical protein n=1 Tax=Cyanophyceae TaxID=3028117 RepID=UPI001681F526|nr:MULTISPECIES: hypothetical protein [Cyanophyceae]MBD1996754.1 hypothetical protein [Leptolyngbya sp. FACHB-541]MBD2055532.1 hypothetical protein [Oculatella sp. FACHB-28]